VINLEIKESLSLVSFLSIFDLRSWNLSLFEAERLRLLRLHRDHVLLSISHSAVRGIINPKHLETGGLVVLREVGIVKKPRILFSSTYRLYPRC
jgi:hypothetical protein